MRYGSVLDPRFAQRRVKWVSERPASYGGSWRLGCVFCASALQRWTVASSSDASSTAASRGHARWSKWALYEALPKDLHSEHVRNHALTEEHKLSVAAYFKPDVPIALVLQASSADDELLKGAVPQPADWVRHGGESPRRHPGRPRARRRRQTRSSRRGVRQGWSTAHCNPKP